MDQQQKAWNHVGEILQAIPSMYGLLTYIYH